MKAPVVFLSYDSDQLDEVVVLAEELMLRGIRTWQDLARIRSGEKIEAEIRRGLGDSDGCVWYVTHEALNSEWVRNLEVPLALARRPPFKRIPVFRSMPDFERAEQLTREAFGVNLAEWSGFLTDGSAESLGGIARGVLSSFLPRDGDEGERNVIDIGLHARSYTPQDEDLTLDWTALLGGHPGTAEAWSRVWRGLLDLRSVLGEWTGCRRIRISGKGHLTAGFAFGMAFPAVSGFSATVDQGGEEWHSNRGEGHGATVEIEWGKISGDSVTVEIAAARPIAEDVTRYLSGRGIAPRARIQVYPAGGASRSSVAPEEAAPLAIHVAEVLNGLRADVGPRRILFFLACPLALAVFTGMWTNAAGAEIQCLEFDDGEYHEALAIPAGRAR